MNCSFSIPLVVSVLLFLPLFFAIPTVRGDQPNKILDPTMDLAEQETLFKIMETLSSDQDWRASYPNPCQPGSSWPGIECRVTGNGSLFHVIRLDFGTSPNPTCKKTAMFPSEIFELPNLESIFIFKCFTDSPTRISFPPSESSGSPLQQLSLRSNPKLVGSVPPEILSLKSLKILTLSQNSLTGRIPDEIFGLSSLLHLDLSYSILSGTIPFQIGNLRSLVGLDLSSNNLTGPIPHEMGELYNLQKLDLNSNSLSGSLPESIQHLGFLVFLDLSSNKLSGSFPEGLAKLQNLQYFLMEDNPMFVPLPSELGHLKKLQELRLGNSGYSGTIPSSYSDLTNLSTLSLQDNQLTGEIPVGFGDLSHIYHLNLSGNLLNGVVPFNSTFLKRLGRNLDLRGNPGICLSPSASSDLHIGVDICENNKTGSFMEPFERSEARKNPIQLLGVRIVALILLTLHQTLLL